MNLGALCGAHRNAIRSASCGTVSCILRVGIAGERAGR